MKICFNRYLEVENPWENQRTLELGIVVKYSHPSPEIVYYVITQEILGGLYFSKWTWEQNRRKRPISQKIGCDVGTYDHGDNVERPPKSSRYPAPSLLLVIATNGINPQPRECPKPTKSSVHYLSTYSVEMWISGSSFSFCLRPGKYF